MLLYNQSSNNHLTYLKESAINMDFTKSSARFIAPFMVLSIRSGETQPQVWPQSSPQLDQNFNRVPFVSLKSRIQARRIQSFKGVVGESTRNAVKWRLDV